MAKRVDEKPNRKKSQREGREEKERKFLGKESGQFS